MKKAIFQKFIIILLLALLTCGSIFSAIMSNIILDQKSVNMFRTLVIMDNALDFHKDLKPQLKKWKKMIDSKRTDRLTVINKEGDVYADSDVTDVSKMENHRHREEVEEALTDGKGFAKRYSKTLHVSMLYVAYASRRGNCILRIAVPFSGIAEYMGMILPAFLVSIGITFILSVILAVRFSRSITKPLNEIAQEMRKLNDKDPQFHFKTYQYEEMNVIADTTMQMAKAVRKSMDQAEFEKMVRQEFFLNASHELKTPITSIKGYTELLENGFAKDEEIKQNFIARIKMETENIINLINDIMMISKLETKEVEVTLSEVRLYPLLSEVYASLEPLAKEYSVSLEVDCRPLVMYVNPQQIRELFNNLITNAIKYNKPDGKVFVTVTSEQNEIIIIVEDTGVGIPEDSKQRVFERFYRVDKGRSKKVGGTGLGLSIVKHIVNYYNGTIQLESRLMEGTKFMIHLPLKKQPNESENLQS
jgi:two-component system phosphate regulon sensor histidine kinase PhoR